MPLAPWMRQAMAAYDEGERQRKRRRALAQGGEPPPDPEPPVNTVAPVVSGTAEIGQTLSTTDGTWTGDAVIVFTYQWKRAGVDIGGATASTYLLVAADNGQSITCQVTGTNGAGAASAASNAAVPYDTDAVLWFAAIVANGGGNPDASFKQAMSAFYIALKADGLYALIDRMGWLAAPDDISSRLDMKDKTTLLTLSVAPTFTPLRGYQGNGTSQFINTLFNSVAPAGNFTQNSCGLTTYLNATASDVGSSTATIGRITSVISFIRARLSGTNEMQGRMTSGVTKTFGAILTRLGFRSISRTASNLSKGYGPDGLQSGTNDTAVSVALVNENFLLLRLQNVYANDRIAFWAAHAGFNDAQTLAFRNALVTALTAIGAN